MLNEVGVAIPGLTRDPCNESQKAWIADQVRNDKDPADQVCHVNHRDSPMQGFLKIESLSKCFVPGKPVFADVSFTLDKGEFVCIIGHSGCGKTTILNVLAGLDTASSGHV